MNNNEIKIPFKKSKLDFLIPSVMDVMVMTVIFVIIFLYRGSSTLEDCDVGYHIMTGNYILKNFHLPITDIYSYTCQNQHWVAFSWGNDLIYALIHKVLGMNGVVIFTVFMICMILFITYKLLLHWKINFFILILSLILVAAITSVHWLARPHIFTAVFTALIFFLLEKGRENNKYYYPIPILILLWCNIHPGFLSGFFLLGIYFWGYLFEYFISKNDKSFYAAKAREIFILGIVCLAITTVNPYGIKLHYYIYKTLTSSWIVNATSEYLSPNFNDLMATQMYIISIVLLIISGFMLKKRVLDMPKILAIIFWGHLSLFAIRNEVLFAIVTIPSLAIMLNEVILEAELPRFKRFSNNLLNTELYLNKNYWPLAFFILLTIIAANNGNYFGKKLLSCDFSPQRIPVSAMNYLKQFPIKGNMMNLDNWGGYIIYKYPERKVFMDGRLDMYQQEYIDGYIQTIHVHPDWKKTLDKYKITNILFENSTHFSNLLLHSPDWRVHYSDDLAYIFVKKEKKSKSD